jgi:formate dehydrogenase iron-sulfur subunit
MDGKARALLIDIKRCIGCRACVGACKEVHGFPGEDTETELSATAYTAMVDHDDETHVRKLCMHCVSPSCVSVCPVGALRKTAAGPVVYDSNNCLGCRYCMVACPFNVPRYEWSSAVPSVRKCDMCLQRVEKGSLPACVEICPAEATVTGTREDLLAEAHRRIREDPGGYFQHVYGETEVGGTSVLFLSPVSFESLGFRQGLGDAPLPSLTWNVLEKIPGVVTVGGAALMAVYWITHRREEVALAAAAAARAAFPPGSAAPKEEAGDEAR